MLFSLFQNGVWFGPNLSLCGPTLLGGVAMASGTEYAITTAASVDNLILKV